MVTPNNNDMPQQANPALKIEDSQPVCGKPTLYGCAPLGTEKSFAPWPDPLIPEFVKLPAPKERCPVTGASRSWILDQERLGRIKIVRIRQPGRMRGACFVYLPSLLALLRNALKGAE